MNRRRNQSAPLARASLDRLLESLKSVASHEWPNHLKRASEIIGSELEKPNIARAVVLDAVAAAHKCALAINSNALENMQYQARNELQDAAAHIRNCIKRIKAPIRHALNKAANSHLSSVVDSESIELFLHECAAIAAANPENADAGRILSALGRHDVSEKNFVPQGSKLFNDFEALHPQDRLHLVDSLSNLTNNSESITAQLVFEGMAASADRGTSAKNDHSEPVLAYLKEVAACWKQFELRPAREFQNNDELKHNEQYKSRFHRFAELILIARLDPGSRTFEPSDHDVARVQRIERTLPQEVREKLIPLRHQDFISDYQVRQALAAADSKNDT